MKPSQIGDFRFLYEDVTRRLYDRELFLVFWDEREVMLCLREIETSMAMQRINMGQQTVSVYGCKPIFIDPDHVDNTPWNEPVAITKRVGIKEAPKEICFTVRTTVEAQIGACLVRKVGDDYQGVNTKGEYVSFSSIPEDERRLSAMDRMLLKQRDVAVDLLELERKMTESRSQ